ncbi:patched family protein [Dictyocaulus viviparus]|uniref:Patched family protein n=1 Tax=Dictyocaulus viviparus TaxID=29172 RepID=A0A0D8Y8U3_DICVI|nr:patched family protein [Dictyocaulus viviparus]
MLSNRLNKSFQYGPIENLEYVTLWYMTQADNSTERKKLQALQMTLFDLSRQDNFSEMISYDIYGDQIANMEMLRGTFYTVKFFASGVILMILFMAVVFNHIAWTSQERKFSAGVTNADVLRHIGKKKGLAKRYHFAKAILENIVRKFEWTPVLILGAIGAPAIATATCFSILGWVNFPFNSIMCITPFLVMGIGKPLIFSGVDDAFLLLHSWRRYGHLPAKERMRVVVYKVGPSMAITSVTNTLAFGIGVASPTPQMSAFCLCTSIAILLDFIFEFLIFCPLLVLYYKEREQKFSYNITWFSWESYINVLFSPLGRLLVVIFTFLLYTCALSGIIRMKPSFDPSKTFPRDSELLLSLHKFESIQREYTPVNFISSLPDLSNSYDIETFYEMVHRLESSEGCYGSERTQIVLRDFIEWENANNNSLSYEHLQLFLNQRQLSDRASVKYTKNNETLDFLRMNFIVICRGDLDWNRRAMKIDSMRKIIDEYPKFQSSLFDYDCTIYDLIITVKCSYMLSLSRGNKRRDSAEQQRESGQSLTSQRYYTVKASFSTLICITPLFFVPVYIIVAFAKTVCIVSALGLLHGIVIIPVCLSALNRNQKHLLDTAILDEQETMLHVK